MMMLPKLAFPLACLVMASILNDHEIAAASTKHVYIVYMGAAKRTERNGHADIVSSLIERNVVLHTYDRSFSGFAARLTDEEAKSLSSHPEVVSVFPDRVFQTQTTRSWDFLEQTYGDLDSTPALNSSSTVGADTIIGFLDSGIWPESPSFNDAGMGPIPPRWKGTCMEGDNFTSSSCNRKLIGARYYEQVFGYAMGTPRDFSGHGTHTASTAAGRHVVGASYRGLAKGTARGGSPNSRIAMYRVCTPQIGCPSSAILKAFDDAISDGVDILSISISDYDSVVTDFSTDPIAIGSFHAVEHGITVVCSAGNHGPSPATVRNFAPWILTVAATTIDRGFEAGVVLGGTRDIIKGRGINFSNLQRTPSYPLIDGLSAKLRSQPSDDAARSCYPSSVDGEKLKGKIILCIAMVFDLTQAINIFEALKNNHGVIGMILINNEREQTPPEFGNHPIATLSEEDGARVMSYIRSNSNPMATILPTKTVKLNDMPAPVIASFSSRGPTPGFEGLLKPDVAAPGVMILAAWPTFDTPQEPPRFSFQSGTSMACPHVAALAAMVKSRNPTWGPSAIRSAIMTTALNRNNQDSPITTITGSRATPYDIGAGEISTAGPFNPGLVYETDVSEYGLFLCDIDPKKIGLISRDFSCPVSNKSSSSDSVSSLNYPSISISNLKKNEVRTVARTVTNVGKDVESFYEAVVEAPAGVEVRVVPVQLRFTKEVRKIRFQVSFEQTSRGGGGGDVLVGSIVWTSAEHKVRSPLVVTTDRSPSVTRSGSVAGYSIYACSLWSHIIVLLFCI